MTMMAQTIGQLKVDVDTSNMDEAIAKAERLKGLLVEVNKLLNGLSQGRPERRAQDPATIEAEVKKWLGRAGRGKKTGVFL